MQTAGSGIVISECEKVHCYDLEVINPFGNGFLHDGPNRDVTIRKWRVVGARTPTGRNNPSSGNGIAPSSSPNGHLTDFKIVEGIVSDCDGSGVNVSHAENGEVRDVQVGNSGNHVTGYAGIRFTNSARNVFAENITVRGMSRALMISASQNVTVRNPARTNLGAEGVLIQAKSRDAAGHLLQRIRIENPGRMAHRGSTTGVFSTRSAA